MSLRDIQLVIFDWDGTVMDSIGKIVVSLQQAALRVNMPVPSAHHAKQIIGLSLDPAFKQLFPQSTQAERDELSEHYKDVYLNHDQTPTPLFPDAHELFSALNAHGYLLSVATGKARRGLDRMMSETNTAHYFKSSRCSDEAHSKPHPDMLQQLLAHHQLEPHQAVMIGDTVHDLAMAQAIDMPRIGITHGVHGAAELMRHQPIAVVDSLRTLKEFLTTR